MSAFGWHNDFARLISMRPVGVKDRTMDETKNLSETEGSRQPVEGSGSSSDEAKNLSDAEGSPCTPSQVEAIFFAALNEKTAAARADYLARACGDDASCAFAWNGC